MSQSSILNTAWESQREYWIAHAYPCVVCDPVGGLDRVGSTGVWGAVIPENSNYGSYISTGASQYGTDYPCHCPLHVPPEVQALWAGAARRPDTRWVYVVPEKMSYPYEDTMPLDEDPFVRWVRGCKKEDEIESHTA